MIGSRMKRCDPIIPSGQARSHIRRQNTIHSGLFQRVEKREGLYIHRCRLVEPCQLLDDDMFVFGMMPIGCYWMIHLCMKLKQ